MRAEKKIDYSNAILIKPRHLKDIYDLFQRYSTDPPRLSVECSNGLNLSPETLEDLLELPNNAQSRIKNIQFRSPYSSTSDISVLLGPTFSGAKNVYLSASGNKDDVLAIFSQLDEVIIDCFPWYANLASESLVFSTISFFSSILGYCMLIISIITIIHNISTFHTILHGWQFMALLLSIGCLFIFTFPLIQFMFPNHLFSIGDGEKQESISLLSKLGFERRR